MATAALTRPEPVARRVPVALAAATVLAQIAYPLVGGLARDRLTVATVVLFAATGLAHAAVWRGRRWAAVFLAVTAGGGLVVEAAGVRTGFPFGRYTYTGTLGWQVAGVPLVIPLAWTMMAYPALAVGRQIGAGRLAGPVAAGAALAAWDLFLDPQMVAAGHWVWAPTSAPVLLGIPVQNFAAWFVVATLLMALLWTTPLGVEDPPPLRRGSSTLGGVPVPVALYLWTYASSVLAHAAFFGLPGSALAGGVGMGAVVALWWVRRPR